MRKILFTTLIAFFVGFNSYAIGYTTVDKIDISEVWIEKNTTADNAILYMNVQNNNLVQFKPGKIHIMLIDLKHELKSRDIIKVTLLTNAGTKVIKASVR